MSKSNIRKGGVRFVAYITDSKGVKHYAREFGLKAFPIPYRSKKKA